jgi:transposase
MAVTIVGTSRPVTGGVDTHLEVNVAAVVDQVGGLLGVESFPTTVKGNDQLLKWMAGFGPVAQVGVEGTSSYGASLARHLRAGGVEVVEVDRPNRQERRRKGKNDTVDAIEAARAAQGQRQLGAAKTKDGNVEAIRALVVAKRSARDTKIKALNQIRHLGFTAPEEIRQSLQGLSRRTIAKKVAAMRPNPDGDPVTYATKTALRTLGRRVLELDAERKELDRLLARFLAETAPGLLGLYGVGKDSAAALLVAAGDNPGRIRSEAARAAVLRSHEASFPGNYNAFPPVLAFATRFQAVSAAFPVGQPALREGSASGGRACFSGGGPADHGSGRGGPSG